MIKVFEKDAKTLNRRSSKGMQLKWESDHKWYKADSVALLKNSVAFSLHDRVHVKTTRLERLINRSFNCTFQLVLQSVCSL